MFILFNNATVHETKAIVYNHKEGIADYKAEHDNDRRQVNIASIHSTTDIYPHEEKERIEKNTGNIRLRKVDSDLLIG
jgi:hypothetical protein